jgi:hypothetical protein
MIDRALTDGVPSKPILAKGVLKWEPFAMLCARFALGAAFLSAVAARFGIWGENAGPEAGSRRSSVLPSVQGHFEFAMGSE